MPGATDPQVSFADWELMQQGMALDPLLAAISDLLEEHHDLIEQVRVDLQRGPIRPELCCWKRKRKTPADRKRTYSFDSLLSPPVVSFLVAHPAKSGPLWALPSYTTNRYTPVDNPYRTASF
jgi:hypothetical protein